MDWSAYQLPTNSGSLNDWTTVNVDTAMEINKRYFTDGNLNMLLPLTAPKGSIIRISNLTGNFTITQNAGQVIHLSNLTSTPGIGGSVASAAVGDGLSLVCETADTDWIAVTSIGAMFTVT